VNWGVHRLSDLEGSDGAWISTGHAEAWVNWIVHSDLNWMVQMVLGLAPDMQKHG
jgi:hypothetical protein